MPRTPPTEPGELGVADPNAAPPDPRVQRLEKRLRLVMFGLLGSVVLIIALGGTTLFLTIQHAKQIAAQKAEEQVQLELLQAIQRDFDQFNTDAPENKLEAYGDLQQQLEAFRNLYAPMAEFDLSDPEGSLDRLLGETDRRRTRTVDN